MASIHVSLSEEMRAYIEEKVSCGAYNNSSEFIRDLIRREQGREMPAPHVGSAMESIAAGIQPEHMPAARWNELMRFIKSRIDQGIAELRRGEAAVYTEESGPSLVEKVKARGAASIARSRRRK